MFTSGNIEGLITAGTDDCVFDASDFGDNVPYKGTYNGKAEAKSFFEKIGKAWGAGPHGGVAITFESSNFEVKDGYCKCSMKIRQLTPDGKVLLGTETHVWEELDVKNKKWKKFTVTQDPDKLHDIAYDPNTNQPILMCKLCWSLFNDGKIDDIVDKANVPGGTFSLLQDEAKESSVVPYAGVYSTEKMKEAFGKMMESLKMDESMKWNATDFKADGMIVTMTAEADMYTVGGAHIKSTEEIHVAEVVVREGGALGTKDWTITKGSAHIAAFTPKKAE